jgi:hypothetical protein
VLSGLQVCLFDCSGHIGCSEFESPVFGAFGLSKRDILSLPDPFAVLTVDGEHTSSTRVVRKNLSPNWADHFDMYALLFAHIDWAGRLTRPLL